MSQFLLTNDHVKLFFKTYPATKKSATIIMVHGFGEHSGRYSHVIDALAQEGYGILAFDLRGHGLSSGHRGDVLEFSDYEKDVLAVIEYVKNNNKNSDKIFILAHSMGALVTLHTLAHAKQSIAGLVMSSPLFALKLHVPLWKRSLAACLARIFPKIALPTGIDGKKLTADAACAKAYDEDPLVLKTLTLRAYQELLKGCDGVPKASSITVPFFMQVAGGDPVVDASCAQRWFDDSAHRAKTTIKIYPGALHEIYNEKLKQLAIKDMVTWFNDCD